MKEFAGKVAGITGAANGIGEAFALEAARRGMHVVDATCPLVTKVHHEAKRFAEAMTVAYRNFHGVETRIVRIFNTYGPRMRLRDGRVVPAIFAA